MKNIDSILSKTYFLIRYLGFKWLLFRLYYYFANKLSILENKMPKLNWIQINSHPAKLDCLNFIQPQRFIIDKSNEERILDEAKNIIRGKMVLFSFHSKNVGFPPNWHKNQMTGEITLKNLH